MAPTTFMDQLAICICTYNRPDGLAAVLRSLDAQRLERLTNEQIAIIVVDNSAENTARKTCEAYEQNSRFSFHAVHEPRKGLVFARNACLDAAHEIEASHILFLDDDEMATPLWIE